MKIIDLSLPIDENAPEVHPVKITRLGHKEGVSHLNWVMMKNTLKGRINYLLGKRIINAADLPEEEFLSLETVSCAVHIGTHVDFTFHYGTKSEGNASKEIDKLPLEWCYADGVVLDLTSKFPGHAITSEDVESALSKINYRIKPGDIVLLRTDADKYFGTRKYLTDYPGVAPSALEFILSQDVKIVGIDALGFDRPYKFMMQDYLRSNDGSYLWPAHFYGRKKEYAHIERLANLDKLPPFGFKLSCLPVKIRGTGAAWSRVVAFIEEK